MVRVLGMFGKSKLLTTGSSIIPLLCSNIQSKQVTTNFFIFLKHQEHVVSHFGTCLHVCFGGILFCATLWLHYQSCFVLRKPHLSGFSFLIK
jgi:hypothetical protein